MQVIQLILRAVQLFLTILIMALDGNTISLEIGGNPSVINYVMFVAVWTMLTLFYTLPLAITEKLHIHKFLPAVLDTLNIIFWFCGGVALAAELHVHSCFNNDYTSNNEVTSGTYNNTRVCQEAQADTAFLWFGFALFIGSLVLSLTSDSGSFRSSRTSRRGPAMSQV